MQSLSKYFVAAALLLMGALPSRAVENRNPNDKTSQLHATWRQPDGAAEAASQRNVQAMQQELLSLRAEMLRQQRASQEQEHLLQQLTTRTQKLQAIAGLTALNGRGVRIVMRDNPKSNAVGKDLSFMPGVVHDFDLLQVVNELRAARAEAIAINGQRIAAWTAIRSRGPVIFINFKAAAAPFTIEAIGNPTVLQNALNVPGSVLQSMRNVRDGNAPVFKINGTNTLRLPAASTDTVALPSAAPPKSG